MKRFLLLFFFAINSLAVIFSQGKTVLVEDNFSSNYYKWWEGRNHIAKCNISHGEYNLSYRGQKSWSSNIRVDIDQNNDWVIESKISRISGIKENGYGLTWGHGRKGYYTFIITPKGRFYVRKVKKGKVGEYLVMWKETPHINKTSTTNKLRIQQKDHELMFFINNNLVAKIPRQPFFGNKVGFMLYQQQQIAADYIVVYGDDTNNDYEEEVVVTKEQPDLQIRQLAIKDNEDIEGGSASFGNGNSIIEPGESIEVTAFVQNFGQADAKNIEAKIILDVTDRNISCPDAYKTFELGEIGSGDYKKLQFFFFTSRRYTAQEIPFKVVLSEKNGPYKKEQELGLKMNERTTNIVDVDLSKLYKNKSTEMRQITEVIEIADVDKNIPVTNFDGENSLAVIIGIEDYKYAPQVDFAKRDAQVFYKYASSVFGIPKQNIYFLTNTEATLGEFKKIFSKDGWLARRSTKGESNIIIYYAGHGAPDIKSKSAYLIPYDIDPNYAKTGFSLNNLYSSLSSLNAKSVTVFLDACFSGKSRDDQMLIAGARSVIIKTKNSAFSAKNMAVLSASSNEEYSAAYPEKHHGIFTYYLLKSLQQNAHYLNTQSVSEFYENIKEEVVKKAGYLDKEQTPSLIGNNKNRPLIVD